MAAEGTTDETDETDETDAFGPNGTTHKSPAQSAGFTAKQPRVPTGHLMQGTCLSIPNIPLIRCRPIPGQKGAVFLLKGLLSMTLLLPVDISQEGIQLRLAD